jgi:hypothetical protein
MEEVKDCKLRGLEIGTRVSFGGKCFELSLK